MDPCYRIKLFREWIGLGQTELGMAAFGYEVDQKKMSRMESDQVPKVTEAAEIARALSVRLPDLLSDSLDSGLVSRFEREYGPSKNPLR